MSLFTAVDLANHLHVTVTDEAAVAAERIVWGWLRPVLGLVERPADVSPEVFSWAIELGGIAHENPAGMSYYQLGDERYGFSAERRAEILAEAAAGGIPGGTVTGPRGTFPPPRDEYERW